MSAPSDEAIDAELVEVEEVTLGLDDVPSDIEDAEVVEVADETEFDETGDVAHDDGDIAPKTKIGRQLEVVANRPILPPKGHAKAVTRRIARNLGRAVAWATTHPHQLLAHELRPICRGSAVTWRAWRKWETEADFAAIVATTPHGAPGHEASAKGLANLRAGHRRLSAAVALLVLAGLVTLWFVDTSALVLVALLAVALFDVIGRKHPPEGTVQAVRRTLLEEGAPLGALQRQVIERLNEDGIRADPGGPMTVHAGGEYRMLIVHEDEITEKHLRSLERHLGAVPTSFRLIATRDAGTSELRMPTRDHLAHVAPRPWAPTGSRTIADPADLWVRSDGDPSRPILAGIHVDMVGTTGSGKSEGLQELILHFGECRDVYPVFIDLSIGPLGPLNKNVLRRCAYTPEDANELLDWVLAQVHERHQILHRLADSDDEDAPTSWDLSWGPQIELIIDEYSFVAAHDELHERVGTFMRIGGKAKVCVVRASQNAGTKDLGSTLAASLVGLKILLACEEADTTKMLSTGHRDRGWTPHELRPAVPGDVRDAGKCFVWGPGHREPEIHRFHAPLEPGEVKRRDRQRAADGLPNLDGTPPNEQEAILLTPVQVAVEEIFAEHGQEWLPTSVIAGALADRGHRITAEQLSVELCGDRSQSKRDWQGRRQIRGYAISDIRRAWGYDE